MIRLYIYLYYIPTLGENFDSIWTEYCTNTFSFIIIYILVITLFLNWIVFILIYEKSNIKIYTSVEILMFVILNKYQL